MNHYSDTYAVRIVQALMRLHDGLTRLLFGISVLAAAYLTLILAWEVLARYLLEKPSGWAPDTASVSFIMLTFLAAPMLSWKHGHATMDMVVKALPQRASLWLQRLTLLIAASVCFMAAWFGWVELLRLYKRGVMMIAVTPIPKWWLMSAIVYALASSGLYYSRHFLCSFISSCANVPDTEV